MGMSAADFWRLSPNGKALVLMLAERNNPEAVRDILDWLVGAYKVDIRDNGLQQGWTTQKANLRAENFTEGLYKLVESVNERNQREVAEQVIDRCFERYFRAGKPKYDASMAWFANEIRKRFKNDPTTP